MNINPNDPKFQLGRYLYDAQVLHADVTANKTIDPERIKQVCERYCELINCVGFLRTDYLAMIEDTKIRATELRTILNKLSADVQ